MLFLAVLTYRLISAADVGALQASEAIINGKKGDSKRSWIWDMKLGISRVD
ncbi:hypothetical protein PMIN05_012302 [Paraphaeosphaeria minitans]